MMKRRDLLRAAVALPVVALLPAMVGEKYVSVITLGTIEPQTAYTYYSTAVMPPVRWVPIGPGVGRGMIFPPMKAFKAKRLVWQKGLNQMGMDA